eukprot:gene4640-4972_t
MTKEGVEPAIELLGSPIRDLPSPNKNEVANPVSEGTPAEFEILISKWRQRVQDFCEGSFWMGFMGLLTIWTLYQGDIRDAATGKEADLAFE